MDPITLIVSAVVAGVGAAAKDTAGQAVRDAYGGLKTLLKRRLARTPGGADALEQAEADGAVDEAAVRAAVAESGAAADEEIAAAAGEVMKAHDPDGFAQGKYTVSIGGVAINVSGGAKSVIGTNTGQVTIN